MPQTPATPRHSSAARFALTRWSIVLSAARDTPAHRRDALEQLARQYWPPLYAYLRRAGHTPDAAADLVQAFFARLIEKHDLRAVDPAKGKFRAFLLASLKHFVSNQRDKERALKRGGGRVISLDALAAESGLHLAPADPRTPDAIFHQRWALTVLDLVLADLRAEYAARSQVDLFDALKGTLTADLADSYATLARRLHTTEPALRAAAHRLRKRYRELLRRHVAHTVADPAMIDEELRDLFSSL